MPSILIYLVDQEVEHNDIKPDNILVGPAGSKLIAFGLATIGSERRRHYDGGTPAYMPPEYLCSPHARPMPGKRDMFALGVTLLFVTGTVNMPAEGWTIWSIREGSDAGVKMIAWLDEVEKARGRIPEGLERVRDMLEPVPALRITAERSMEEYEMEEEESLVAA